MNEFNTITQFPKSAIERLPFPINRKSLEQAIEVLIQLTEMLEPDCDLEPDLDGEPGTWTENQSTQRLALQGEDLEDNGDYEPSLLCQDDLELDECDLEPNVSPLTLNEVVS